MQNKSNILPILAITVITAAMVLGMCYFVSAQRTIRGTSEEVKQIAAGMLVDQINQGGESLGGVVRGSDYQATSTNNMEGGSGTFASNVHKVIATTTPIGHTIYGDNGIGYFPTLGSVTIVSSTPHYMKIKNATSTTDKASTTVAVFDNNASDMTAGTYVFDMVMTRGIVLEFESGFDGSYIITWR